MSRVVWVPQARQREFLSRPEDEALYGGAAGGGKSEALVIEALRQIGIGHYRALILRGSYPQLTELIDKSLRYYPAVSPGARFNATNHTWTFPSGARIRFGSLHTAQDRVRYQGLSFDFIAFDELTHFCRDDYLYLLSRNRPGGPGTRVYMRATANPGGIGHGWVKERFITAGPPGRTLWESYPIRFPDGHTELRRRSRVFIPSTVFDNQILLRNDPDYLTRLSALPDAERRALLFGDWDSFSGQVFLEWRNDPARYADRIGTHVIAPFRIPSDWEILRGFDWGYRHPFAVCWFACDRDGRPRLYIFRTCPHFIRTVPSLVYSSVNVEDVDTSGEDHIYDASRYVLMSHPLPSSSSLALGEDTLGEDTLEEDTLGAS